MKFLTRLLICTLMFGLAVAGHLHALTLPAIFNSHMVLQQKTDVTLWGWGNAGEEIRIITSWNQQNIQTKVDNHGNWKATLNTPAYGGPYTITLKGHTTIILEDILIGEVWICSGQSNMEWTPNAGIDNAQEEIQKANYPEIRFFQVAHQSADYPQLDVKGNWEGCTPASMQKFSAVGYFFAQKLQKNLNIPIGVINSSWGGTPAEAWTKPEVIQKDKVLLEAANALKEVPWGPVKPGKLYHTMIAPLIPFRIAGVIWYQGESNTGTAATYSRLFSTMIQSWRTAWSNDFPFYFVQIAPYKGYSGESGVALREQQRLTLDVPLTGMVVISDIGDLDDIHPKNKKDVGFRLANWALHKTYGKKEIRYSGPLFREIKREGKKIRVFFDYAEDGLLVRGKELTHFEVAGEDLNFVPAKAVIEGSTVLVSAKTIKTPMAVRFAWSNTATPNLFNSAGLPASCFRTDLPEK